MTLKSGTIIPFQFKDTKKLISIPALDKSEKLTFCDVKSAIHSGFAGLNNCEFYNPKIGFHIPQELLIPYLEQRHDLTNFVIEIFENNSKEDDKEDNECMQQNQSAPEPRKSNEPKKPIKRDFCDVSKVLTKKSKLTVDPIDHHLETVLESSSEGQAICNNHKSSKELNEEDRLTLVQLVISFEFDSILKSNLPLTIDSQRLINLASAIVRRFPCEDSSNYYIAHSKTLKHIAGGRLYEQFHAMKVQFMEMESSNRYCDTSQHTIERDFPELEDLHEISGHWWPYFKAWRHTFELRMAYVRNIINPMPYFEKLIARAHDKSIDLVEYDFDRLHPEKSSKLFDNWDLLSERIFTEALVFCRDDVPLILDLYGQMTKLCGFMMLSYLLENYESDDKPFQRDDPGNLVTHIESINGKPEDFFKEYCRTRNLSTPIVFVTEKNSEEMHFYVLVGDNLFSMENELKAVDFCFKCFQVLQLPYPSNQSQAWRVVQEAFYGIHTDYDDDDKRGENFLKIFRHM